jgi:hypothetical protein
VESGRQGDGVTWLVDIDTVDQVYGTVGEHLQSRKYRLIGGDLSSSALVDEIISFETTY